MSKARECAKYCFCLVGDYFARWIVWIALTLLLISLFVYWGLKANLGASNTDYLRARAVEFAVG